jgi:hypothetical protein
MGIFLLYISECSCYAVYYVNNKTIGTQFPTQIIGVGPWSLHFERLGVLFMHFLKFS